MSTEDNLLFGGKSVDLTTSVFPRSGVEPSSEVPDDLLGTITTQEQIVLAIPSTLLDCLAMPVPLLTRRREFCTATPNLREGERDKFGVSERLHPDIDVEKSKCWLLNVDHIKVEASDVSAIGDERLRNAFSRSLVVTQRSIMILAEKGVGITEASCRNNMVDSRQNLAVM